MIVVAVLNATYFAHKDFFGVWNCSVVLRYKGQDSIIFYFPCWRKTCLRPSNFASESGLSTKNLGSLSLPDVF